MNFFLVIPVALALAMDAFAVSVGLSVLPEGLKKSSGCFSSSEEKCWWNLSANGAWQKKCQMIRPRA